MGKSVEISGKVKKTKLKSKLGPKSALVKRHMHAENPFETTRCRHKFNILGKKFKGSECNISVARSRAIDKRKGTLLKEYEQSKKSSLFLDKRIGENNTEIGEFERAIIRSQRERWVKMKRNSKCVLPDEENYLGDGLSFIPTNDDSERGTFLDDLTDEEIDEARKTKSRKEVMDEVIFKSKYHKAQRAFEKEGNERLVEDLDKNFKSLRGSLFSSTTHEKAYVVKALQMNEISADQIEEQQDQYDKLVNEMAHEIRSHPSSRTKTPEEIAQAERERLEQLEEDRQKRMLAHDYSDDEATYQTGQSAQGLRPNSGDDIVDSFLFDEEKKSGAGWVDEMYNKTDIEASNSEDDSCEESSHSKESVDGSDDEDSDENFTAPWELNDDSDIISSMEYLTYSKENFKDGNNAVSIDYEKQPGVTKTLVSKGVQQGDNTHTAKHIPYLIQAPTNYQELCEMLENRSDADVIVIINRILKSNAIKLAAENRKKMQVFYGLLLQFFAVVSDKKPINFNLLNLLVKPLIELSMEIPYFSAICARQRIIHIRKQFCEAIRHPGSCCWPSFKTLALLKLWSMIFPCSDFRHVVMTPATLLMSEYLMRCPTLTIRDMAFGSFLCSMILAIAKQSKKFFPEAISFLQTLLTAAIEEKGGSQGSMFHHLLRPNPAGSLLCLHPVKDVHPLNFLAIVNMSEDSSFFSSDEFRCGMLLSVVESLRGFVDIYTSLCSFPEIFLPVSSLLHEVSRQPKLPASIHNKLCKLSQLIEKQALKCCATRQPLQMRKRKPLPIKLLTPKFEDNYVKGRDYDPDRERAEKRKFQKLLRREARGAARELRKDNYFLLQMREKERALQEEERAEKYGKARAFLQEQQHAYKSGQLGRGRKRRR